MTIVKRMAIILAALVTTLGVFTAPASAASKDFSIGRTTTFGTSGSVVFLNRSVQVSGAVWDYEYGSIAVFTAYDASNIQIGPQQKRSVPFHNNRYRTFGFPMDGSGVRGGIHRVKVELCDGLTGVCTPPEYVNR